MSEEPQSAAKRLHGLDALRGIAAFCVVLMHAAVLFEGRMPDFAPKAYLAVDFFFVLSGYVMARTYEPRMAAGLAPLKFFLARLKRLWPTMFLGGLLFLPFLAEGNRGEIYDPMLVVALNLMLLPSLWTGNLFPLNVPAWSIFFELVANLFHAALLWKRSSTFIALTGLACLIALGWFVPKLGSLNIGAHRGELLAGLARVGFTYCMGILLWRLWGQRQLPALTALPALLVMPVVFAYAPLAGPAWWSFDLAFVIFAAPLILIGGLALRGGRKLALIAGELSFPLYAVHYPTLYWCREAGMGAFTSILTCLLAAGAVAAIQTGWSRYRKVQRLRIEKDF